MSRPKRKASHLFRYTRKRNRLTKDTGEKWHGPVRKGWNVLGDSHTLNIGTDRRIKIDIKAMRHPTIDTEGIEPYRPDAQFFVKEDVDNSGRYYVASGSSFTSNVTYVVL
ncbi:MAG: hypothetical protein IJU62_03345 [Muribaculaceae bacterium]|nr:hypothetical protein [Muribaculaceae bacterium]